MKSTIHTLILRRLESFYTATDIDQLNAAKEIIQELALFGLSRHGLFKVAAFHGGTCLRIFYGLDRFSEDLDFALIRPDLNFKLDKLTQAVVGELAAWGVNAEVTDRSKADSAVKKAFIKTGSLGLVLKLNNPIDSKQKFLVKLELDVNPPLGAKVENRLCPFPVDFSVVCHDMPSLFAGKIHALLCRKYVKGRDWFDFARYLGWKTKINLTFLGNALAQFGPYAGLVGEKIELSWVLAELEKRIEALDVKRAMADTLPFVSDPNFLGLWSNEFFLERLARYGEEVT